MSWQASAAVPIRSSCFGRVCPGGGMRSLLNFQIYQADADLAASQVARWSMGKYGRGQLALQRGAGAAALAGAVFFLTQSRTLDRMLLGDDAAITLGTDPAPAADDLSGGCPPS